MKFGFDAALWPRAACDAASAPPSSVLRERACPIPTLELHVQRRTARESLDVLAGLDKFAAEAQENGIGYARR